MYLYMYIHIDEWNDWKNIEDIIEVVTFQGEVWETEEWDGS